MLLVKPLQHQTGDEIKILVFKTNLITKEEVNDIAPLLQNHVDVLRWNVDHHDKDNVLRIETTNLLPGDIELLLREAGYFCEELPD